MAGSWRVARWVEAGLLFLSVTAAAQIKVGDFSSDASATISTGYTASYSNLAGSTHSWSTGGSGTLSGSYHSPNFLAYNANIFLNQSRANSNFQSISNASGVNLTTNIFSGSKFPGAISYSKAYNSEGNYAIPGLANYVTHGNSDTLGIVWNESLPDRPSFSAGYQMGTSRYSVYGTDNAGSNRFHSLSLHSGYIVDGFSMGAYYSLGGGRSQIPGVVSGGLPSEVHNNTSGLGFNVSHPLPMSGSASAAVNRSTWKTNYLGATSSGTINTMNGLAAIHPTNKLAMSVSTNYSDNLAGQLIESVTAAGGVVPILNSNQSSNSLDVMGVGSYSFAPNAQASAFIERRTQEFLGVNYGVTSYGGSATYAHTLWRGTINASGSTMANASDKTGQDSLGFSSTENYSTVLMGWHVTESFGYSQNVQTLLITYTNSFYNYSANIRRNWGRFNVGAGAGGARTALTEQAGTADSSESFNASMGFGSWISANGSYSKSSGQAIATSAGLVPVPVPSPTLPSSLVSLFGGKSYSFGVSSSPVKRLILASAYARSNSNTSSGTFLSANQNNEFNSLVQYQFRKLYFTSGYSRLEQGFSGSNTKPEVVANYYFGVSRWFNFF